MKRFYSKPNINLNKLFYKKNNSDTMSEKNQEPKALELHMAKLVHDLIKEVKCFMGQFDKDKNGKISINELKDAIQNPIGKRYFLVFVLISVNIGVAIAQYYILGNPIGVNTLITLVFSVSTVLFAGYIENVNGSLLQEKDRRIEELKDQNLESLKLVMQKDSEIKIQKQEIEQYKKILEKKE